MPDKTRFDTKTLPFANRGVVQRLEPGSLGEGQYVYLRNVTSIQEGALEVRPADKRVVSLPAGRDAPYIFARLRTGANEANNRMYVGEGTDILRFDGNFNYIDWANSNPLVYDPIKERWTAVPYNAGASGTPYIYFASPRLMLRDKASNVGGLLPWGIFPPTAPPKAVLGSTRTKAVAVALARAAETAGDNIAVDIPLADADLSRFTATIGSGLAEGGYDADDFVAITFDLADYPGILDLRVQFDVTTGGSEYVDYYEASVMGLKEFAALSARMPESATIVTPQARIRKSQFDKIGVAGEGGTTGRNWRNVQRARLVLKVAADHTVDIGLKGIALEGGYGPDNNRPAMTAYRWVYTYRDPESGQESNPCAEMLTTLGIVAEREPITLTLTGTGQANAPSAAAGTIAIYRCGGSFADNTYRLVGYATNPGANLTVAFTDASSDSDIAGARQLAADNDPPVTSNLPKQVEVSSVTPCAPSAWTTVTVTGSLSGVTKYSRMWLRDLETGTTEEVRADAVTANTVTVYCQYPHSGGGGGITLTCYAATGVPCSYAAQAGDCVYLAGDVNNPHILYRSRRGKPEAFPVTAQLPVGSPSNPIQNIVEFGGEVVVLNLTSIYIVRTAISGEMMPPLETPAQRGLLTPWAWCKGDNELYYLAYDGIYAWAGGQSRKISESIDWMFKARMVGGLFPVDMLGDNKRYIQFEFFRNKLRVIYRSTDGKTRRMYYDAGGDRWELGDSDQDVAGGRCDLAMFTDRERGRMFIGKYKAGGGAIDEADQFGFNVAGAYGATDGFTQADGLGGTAISYGFRTGPFHLGLPSVQKLFTDIVLEVEADEQFAIKLYYDFSDTADAADTFTIPGGSGRRRVSLPLQQDGDPIVASGKQAYAVAFEITGSATKRARFYSLTFVYAPLTIVQRGKATDWEDLGYAHDKRLGQLVLEYDLRNLAGAESVERTLDLDIVYGINGNTVQEAVASFVLGGTGTGRTKVTLPISSSVEGFSGDKVVCKMVRLRPRLTAKVESVLFEIFSYDFIYEKLPPDITYFTDPSDCGYPYEKYFEQLVLDVDTANQPTDIAIYLDGDANPAQTIPNVSTTFFDRRRVLTLLPGMKGRMVRMVFAPHAPNPLWKFQLFSQEFIFEKADKGPVFHSNDWDDLGYPHDKRLYSVSIEYEVSVQTTMNLSLLCGLAGAQAVRGPYAITLEAGGRKRATFPFPDAGADGSGAYPFICKMVNFQPATTNVAFRAWKVSFDFEKYPQDTVRVTDYKDFGSPYEKYFQQLVLRVATGGVNATVVLEIDGADSFTIATVNSVDPTREIVYTLPAGTKGRNARLRATPGGGGKFQLWDWNCITAPADKGPVLHTNDWDDLGYPHDKRLKAVTIQYEVTQGTTMGLYLLQGFGAGQSAEPLPVQLALRAGSRKIETYRLDGQVVKAVRFQPAATNTAFKSWSYKFEMDELPPDFVSETKWEDYGYPYEKILQQLAIEIDTGGQPCDIDVVGDIGAPGVQTTLQVTTTEGDMVRLLTLPVTGHAVPIMAKRFKLVLRPSAIGKAQLYSYYMHWLRANPGPVEHSGAWDSVEHPYDKRFSEVTIEYDANGTAGTQVALDTITGLHGDQINLQAATFTLAGAGHGLQTFAIQPEVIAKMVRLRPVSIPITDFRMWKYRFTKFDFPPDIVVATEWVDLGWPYEKILKTLTLDVDTGGVPAQVDVQADGGGLRTIEVNTTAENRSFVTSMASDLIGKRFRLRAVPGPGGKFQLFDYKFDAHREPPQLMRLDTYEQYFGSAGWKTLWQIWLEYMCAGEVRVSIYRDGNVLFLKRVLPAHGYRDTERFCLDSAVNGVLNKSKSYRVLLEALEAGKPFKLYRDSSRVETIQHSGDIRAAFYQNILWPDIAVGN